ncbi:MAG TPA: hypothetical protein DCY94_03030 [Firmicutes bacterium]|nr:hypothetical protein [Bacillota bacterium]
MLETIIEDLEEKIVSVLNDSSTNEIFATLKVIDAPTLIVGVGGSRVVCEFLDKVLFTKNGIISRCIDFDEYASADLSNYENIIVVSYSGKNHGVKSIIKDGTHKKYLLTSRKSRIKDETILHYDNKKRTKSFISIEDTFIPLSIVLSYYLGETFPRLQLQKEKYDFSFRENVDLIYDYNSKATAKFLETSLVEAGIAHVTMHTKYSLCHGRSNIISSNPGLIIYLQSASTDLDELLLTNLPKINENIVILKTDEQNAILGDYILMRKSLDLLNYIERSFNKEFVQVKYNRIVPTLYNFKGEF